MDENIRIERLPEYSPNVRENGRAEGDKKKKKKSDEEKKKKRTDISDEHVDTVA